MQTITDALRFDFALTVVYEPWWPDEFPADKSHRTSQKSLHAPKNGREDCEERNDDYNRKAFRGPLHCTHEITFVKVMSMKSEWIGYRRFRHPQIPRWNWGFVELPAIVR